MSGPSGVQALEQGRVVRRRGEDARRTTAVEVEHVVAHVRLERDGQALAAVVRPRQGPGALVDPMQAEVRAQPVERLERDTAVRRQLAAGHAQHPRAADGVDGLAPGAHAFAGPAGSTRRPANVARTRLASSSSAPSATAASPRI